nr:zinc finger CCCH domain protein [Ipomoea batatas]
MGLLKENPESFEDNVMGSIVRINSNSKKRSYNLHQVIGVSQSSGEPNLGLSNMEAEVPISELSDRYFTEEEFESKAQSLHKFLTKNWIDRELVSLKQRIDLANEKGRGAEYPLYMCII